MRIVTAAELLASFTSYEHGTGVDGVAEIVAQVREGGDEALRQLTLRFDGVALEEFRVEPSALRAAYERTDAATIEALRAAARA